MCVFVCEYVYVSVCVCENVCCDYVYVSVCVCEYVCVLCLSLYL